MSIIIATYCSKEKIETQEALPAVDLYISERINEVAKIAEEQNLPLYILSGKYGLIHANDLIEHYDHLLDHGDVREHAQLVAQQLEKAGVEKINFFTQTLESDPNVAAYWISIQEAVSATNCEVEFIIV